MLILCDVIVLFTLWSFEKNFSKISNQGIACIRYNQLFFSGWYNSIPILAKFRLRFCGLFLNIVAR